MVPYRGPEGSLLHGGVRLILGGWGGGGDSHAGGVEGEGFDFGFGAIGGDFLAVEEERDAGGIADFGDDFAAGSDRGVGGGDQGFVADGLSVGGDGDPGSFGGADKECKSRRRCF